MGDTDQAGGDDFSYREFHKSDRVWLRRTAAAIRVKLRRNVRDTIDSGQALLRAHRRLGRAWRRWLRAEDIAVRTATRLVGVYAVFGALPADVTARFTPSALFALTESAIPRSLREYAVQVAQDDPRARITRALVEEWAREYKAKGTDAPLSLATTDEAAQSLDAARRNAAENWEILDGLIGPNGAVHLTASTDTDNGLRTISGTLLPEAGKARYADGPRLDEVVLGLAGRERVKRCKTCGQLRRLEHFSERKDSADGRNTRCLYCERKRVKEYTRRKQHETRAA
jgi:hypothetical protein